MENEVKRRGIHPGWWVIITSFIIMLVVYAPVITLTGVFFVPISNALNVSRTAVTFSATLGFLASIPACLLAGVILKTMKIRYLEVTCLLITCATFIWSAFTSSLMILYVCFFIRGFTAPFVPMICLSILTERWFAPSVRGKALGVATVASGIGAMILNPVTAMVIEKASYSGGFIFFAILALIPIPFVLAFWKDYPADAGVDRVGAADAAHGGEEYREYGPTLKKALLSPVFIISFLAMFVLCGGTQTIVSLGASCNVTLGFDPVTAASLISFASFGIVVGKLGLGAVIDRWGLRTGTMAGGILLASGYIIMLMQFSAPKFVPMAIGYFIGGLGIAIVNLGIPLVASVLIGNRSYGTCVSMLQMASSLGAGILPTLLSKTYETTGAYTITWTICIGFAAAFGIMMFVVLTYRKHHPLTD